MKNDILKEAVMHIDADLVEEAGAFSAGAQKAVKSRTGKRAGFPGRAVATAAGVILLAGGITAGLIVGSRKPGLSGGPRVQSDPGSANATSSVAEPQSTVFPSEWSENEPYRTIVLSAYPDGRLRFQTIAGTPKIELAASDGSFRPVLGTGRADSLKNRKALFKVFDGKQLQTVPGAGENGISAEKTFSIRLCRGEWDSGGDYSYVFDIYEGAGTAVVSNESDGTVFGAVQLTTEEISEIAKGIFPTLGTFLDAAAESALAGSAFADVSDGTSPSGQSTVRITDGIRISKLVFALKNLPVVEADGDGGISGSNVLFGFSGPENGGGSAPDISIIGGPYASVRQGGVTKLFRIPRAQMSELEMIVPDLVSPAFSGTPGSRIEKIIIPQAVYGLTVQRLEWDYNGDGTKDLFRLETASTSGILRQTIYYVDAETGSETQLCVFNDIFVGIGFIEGDEGSPVLFDCGEGLTSGENRNATLSEPYAATFLAEPFAKISTRGGKPYLVSVNGEGDDSASVTATVIYGNVVKEFLKPVPVRSGLPDERILSSLDNFRAEVCFRSGTNENGTIRFNERVNTLYGDAAKALYRASLSAAANADYGQSRIEEVPDSVGIVFISENNGEYYFCGRVAFQSRESGEYMELSYGSLHSETQRFVADDGTYEMIAGLAG